MVHKVCIFLSRVKEIGPVAYKHGKWNQKPSVPNRRDVIFCLELIDVAIPRVVRSEPKSWMLCIQHCSFGVVVWLLSIPLRCALAALHARFTHVNCMTHPEGNGVHIFVHFSLVELRLKLRDSLLPAVSLLSFPVSWCYKLVQWSDRIWNVTLPFFTQ